MNTKQRLIDAIVQRQRSWSAQAAQKAGRVRAVGFGAAVLGIGLGSALLSRGNRDLGTLAFFVAAAACLGAYWYGQRIETRGFACMRRLQEEIDHIDQNLQLADDLPVKPIPPSFVRKTS